MSLETPDVEQQVRIAAPPELVFSFFTEPARLARWIGENPAIEPRPGGGIRVEFPKAGGGLDVMRGRFVEVDPPRRIVFTWGFEGDPALPPGASTVEVTFAPDGDGTLVRLVHRDLPAAQRAPHQGGWQHFLAQLATVVVDGERPGG